MDEKDEAIAELAADVERRETERAGFLAIFRVLFAVLTEEQLAEVRERLELQDLAIPR
jgi:hypothetical protein